MTAQPCPLPTSPRRRRQMTPTLRQQVLARDGWRCRRCGFAEGLELHHRTAFADGGACEPANLITLCGACHHEWTIHAEGVIPWADWFSVPGVAMATVAFVQLAPANATVGALRESWARRREELDRAARESARAERRRRERERERERPL